MIRRATVDDAEAIAAIGRRLHDESPDWSRFQYDEARVALMMRTLVGMEFGFVLVVEVDGVLVGGIAGMASAHWSSNEMIAQEMSFFIVPEHRGGLTGDRTTTGYDPQSSNPIPRIFSLTGSVKF